MTKKIPRFPEFVDFHSISPSDYMKLVRQYDPYSDFNYISIYCWSDPHDSQVSQLNNNIVLRIPDYFSGTALYSFLGTDKVTETTKILLDYLRADNRDNVIDLVPGITASMLKDDQSFVIKEDIDNHDYILSARLNVALEGKEFANKRRFLSKFTRSYPDHKVADLDLRSTQNKVGIKTIANNWKYYNTDGSTDAERELHAIDRFLNGNFEEVYGLGVYIGNDLEAFCIFEVIRPNYAVLHFIKSNLKIQHLHEFMLNNSLKHIYSNFGIDWVNYEQDLGIEGLRLSKQKQRPVKYLKKYSISIRNT